MDVQHKPVRVRGSEIECRCGWTSESAKSEDEAWDQYDEHTMSD